MKSGNRFALISGKKQDGAGEPEDWEM